MLVLLETTRSLALSNFYLILYHYIDFIAFLTKYGYVGVILRYYLLKTIDILDMPLTVTSA